MQAVGLADLLSAGGKDAVMGKQPHPLTEGVLHLAAQRVIGGNRPANDCRHLQSSGAMLAREAQQCKQVRLNFHPEAPCQFYAASGCEPLPPAKSGCNSMPIPCQSIPNLGKKKPDPFGVRLFFL